MQVLNLEGAAEGNFSLAHFEASTDYASHGVALAPFFKERIPWTKFIISLREPISRGISYLNHQVGQSQHRLESLRTICMSFQQRYYVCRCTRWQSLQRRGNQSTSA